MIPNDYLSLFTLPTIRNHTVAECAERAPWEGENTAPTVGLSKVGVRKFHANPTTNHLYYSAYEGDNNTRRLSKDNPPRLLRAVCVDYDCYQIDDATLGAVVEAANPSHSPAFISRSHSGGVHAIWCLEEPVWVMSHDLRVKLLAWFKKHLKLGQFLPGMDEKVYGDAMIYFACGRDWQQLDSTLISKDTIARAMMESASKASFRGNGVAIPLDVVAAEVQARYPGRWVGDFEENSRGVRFWDDVGDAQSAIVKPEGMLCYTGERGFMDWASLFGTAFVEKYLDDKVGGALENRWFDGADYWIFSDTTNAWRKISREDLGRKLKVQGLSAVAEKGMTYSLVDKTLDAIAEQNHVSSAAPFVQRPAGLLFINGERHLNIASTKVVPPADGECYMEDFPWIANLLDNSFVSVKDGHGQQLMEFAADPQEQLWRFLAWFKRAYEAGLNFRPEQGHVLVLAGEPGCGKTLMADVLVGKALGGKVDATRFILGETNFNKKMFHVPCWTINDAAAATDPHRKAKYNSLVKQVAANREFTHEAKGKDAVDVAWMGRLIITCNVDPESIQVMPSMDSSMADKILALKVCGANPDDSEAVKDMERVKQFGLWNGRKPDENIAHELPAFLRWLLNWTPPDWLECDPRFGYRAFAHEALREHADSVGYFAPFNEVLGAFFDAFFLTRKDETDWRGTATELLEAISSDASPVKQAAKEYNSRNMGRGLASLVNRKDGKCRKNIKDGRSVYTFSREKWLK